MGGSLIIKEMRQLILDIISKDLFYRPTVLYRRVNSVAYFKTIKANLENDIELASNISDFSLKKLIKMSKKNNIKRPSFQAFYSFFLVNCGLLNTANKLLKDIDQELELDIYPLRYNYLLGTGSQKRYYSHDIYNFVRILYIFSNLNQDINYDISKITPKNELMISRKIISRIEEMTDHLLTDEASPSQVVRDYNEIVMLLLTSIRNSFMIEDSRKKTRTLYYLKSIKQKTELYLNKQRNKLRNILIDTLNQIDRKKRLNYGHSKITHDNDTPPFISGKIRKLLSEYRWFTKLNTIETLDRQLLHVIHLLEEYSITKRTVFLKKYWTLFINKVNSSANLLEAFTTSTILTKKDIMYYLLLNNIYPTINERQNSYDEIISIIDNCNKKEFSLIQRFRFGFYTGFSTIDFNIDQIKPIMNGLLNIVKPPFTITDLKTMHKIEIEACKEIFNLWSFQLRHSKRNINKVYEKYRELILDFFKNEEIIITAKLVSSFYLINYVPQKTKDIITTEIIDKIFEIITILVDKRNEKNFVDNCIEAQKIIHYFTGKESRSLESAKLIENVWKDEDIQKNIKKYLNDLKRSKEKINRERKIHY